MSQAHKKRNHVVIIDGFIQVNNWYLNQIECKLCKQFFSH